MNISRLLRNIGNFLFTHRNRILIASIVAILVAIIASYYETWSPLRLFRDNTSDRRRRTGADNDAQSRNKSVLLNGPVLSSGHRSRLLLRVRRQFDISCRHFLPTLRKKIFDVVDINATIKQIKDIRAAGSADGVDLERALWEDIKVSSFALLFMAIYSTVAICTTLRLQLHVLAKSIISTEQLDPRIGNGDEEMTMDNQMFRALIDGTYGQLFRAGIAKLSQIVRSVIADEMSSWGVKEKVRVEYDELLQMIRTIKQRIDQKLDEIIKQLFISAQETEDPFSLESRLLSSTANGRASPSSAATNMSVSKLLNQTWDILESSAYRTVFKESLDSCFRIATEQLHSQVFFPQHSPPREGVRSPPLASLLPQIKAIVNELIPENMESREGSQILHYKTLSSGPLLESLSLSIIDARE